MNDRLQVGDFISFGLLASVFWHSFWVLFMVPVLILPPYVPARSSSIFLGAILRDSDLTLRPTSVVSFRRKPMERTYDFSRDLYFYKYPESLYKPMTPSGRTQLAGEKEAPVRRVSVPARQIQQAAFGFGDFSGYIENVDFSDLKNICAREDLSRYADFLIFLTQDGQVKDIKKTTGSGDPALDLSIMRKLKMAVFKDIFVRTAWIRIRFKMR